MKLLPLFSALLAVATAAPLAEEAAQQDVQDVQNADAEAPGSSSVNGVKILPRFSMTSPKDGAQRTTVKYGTYSVSSTRMLQTTKLAKGPCPLTGCYVTGMEATIRYPDGKEANVDTNAWLHHIALFGSGGGQGSLWACGNERPTLRLNAENKYGLDFPASFMLMIDLMTEEVAAKSLTLEITYEWVPKTAPGYKAAAMYWLTIGEPAAKEGVYSFKTIATASGYNAKLLYAIGHMHDGGTDMRLFVNSKMVCKSVMHYNTRVGYGAGGAAASGGAMAGMSHGHSRRDGHGGHGGGMDHISDPGACTDFGTLAKGDRLTSEAWYDANQHPLMVHNGKKENLMGNMRVYIGPM
jgi:hypothetical protein